MKKSSQEKYLKPIDQFTQNSNGLHYVSKPRSKSTCFGDLEQIQLLQLSLSPRRRSKSGNKDRRRNSRSQNKSPENHQFQPTKDKMDTVIRKSNGTGLKPNQELRRCSFQSGGGLVTVNFIGASEKTPKSPVSRKNSNASIKKCNSSNNETNMLARTKKRPVLRRKSSEDIPDILPSRIETPIINGDSLDMPKEPVNPRRQRKSSAPSVSSKHSTSLTPCKEETQVKEDQNEDIKSYQPIKPTKNLELRKKMIRKDKRRSSIHNLEFFMT